MKINYETGGKKRTKNNLLGGESNPGQPGDSRLYLTTILPKISHFKLFIHFDSIHHLFKFKSKFKSYSKKIAFVCIIIEFCVFLE